jgi:ketosteroid isomerase-like protein
MPDLAHAIEQFHRALDAFVTGDPEPAKAMFSHRDDVSLANPFGPPVRGWDQVENTMEHAAAQLREGEPMRFERISDYETAHLAYSVWIERSRMKVGSADELAPTALRVTVIWRPEDGEWKIVHRHADPITVPRAPESIVEQ